MLRPAFAHRSGTATAMPRATRAEGRAPRVFDDPAFEGNAAVEVQVYWLDTLKHANVAQQFGAHASQIEFGSGQESTQWVMQLACQASFFALTHGQQIACERAQL